MRRFEGVLFVTLFCCSALSGQSLSDIGVKGGINYARISETGTMPGTTESVNRFIIGVYGDFELLSFLFIRYELFYSNKGTIRTVTSDEQTHAGDGTEWSFTTRRKLSYIDPTMTVHIPFFHTAQIRFRIFTGASFSMNVRASSSVEGIYAGEPYDNTGTNSDSFLPLDPGFVAGIGIDYDLQQVGFSLDVRYVHGLMNIWDRGALHVPEIIENEAGPYILPEMRNRTVSIMVGIAI